MIVKSMSRFFRIITNKRIIGSYQWSNLSRFGVNNFVFSQKSLFASAPHPNNGANVALNEVFDDGDNGRNRGGGSSWFFEYLRSIPGAIILGGCTIIGTFVWIGTFDWILQENSIMPQENAETKVRNLQKFVIFSEKKKEKAQADRDWDKRIWSEFDTPIAKFKDVNNYVSRRDDEYSAIKALCTPDVSSYSYIISGKKMIGKSTMVCAAINELRDKYNNIVYFNFGGGSINGFDEALNAFPPSTYGFYPHPTDVNDAFTRTLADIPSQLAKMASNDKSDAYAQRINTLVLDSVNELNDENLYRLLGFIKDCVDKDLLKVILVVSPGETLLKIVQYRYTQGRIFMGYNVKKDMADEEATKYIQKWKKSKKNENENDLEEHVMDDDKFKVIKEVTGNRIGYLKQIMTEFGKENPTKNATKQNMVNVLYERGLKGRINEAIERLKKIGMKEQDIESLLFKTLPNKLSFPQYEILSNSNIVSVHPTESKLEWECEPIKLCFQIEELKKKISTQIKYPLSY